MSDPTPIQAPALSSLDGVRHAFFTRVGGVSQGIYASLNGGIGSNDDPAAITENRSRMAAHLLIHPGHLLSVWQHHSAICTIVNEPFDLANRPRADAMATRVRGLGLAIGTADCGPILFADQEAGVVGGAHSGWKGALTGVMDETVRAMESLGARRDRITAVLGPTISQAAYEVGPEFVDRFVKVAPGNERYFVASTRPDHAMFDLPGYIRSRLEALDLAGVHDVGVCTYADEALFSYRRMTHRGEADYGRQMSVIALA